MNTAASSLDVRSTKLDRTDAKKRIASILNDGTVTYTTHAKERLKQHHMVMVDVTNVLRGGRIVEEGEAAEDGAYRYRVHTPKMCVVVELLSDIKLRVITAWRKKT